MQRLLVLAWLLCLSACFKAEPEALVSNAPQSTIGVKSQTRLLDFKPLSDGAKLVNTDNAALIQAFERKQSDIFVEGSGKVKKLLPDDYKGSRHQRFLVSISDQQTLLFAHNIDLAERINAIAAGDTITFRGEYVYNPKGGIMHWTHHDPKDVMQGGWIQHNGKTYQ